MHDMAAIPLRAWREATGKSIISIWEETGICRNTLYKIEHGITSKPQPHTLVRLAEAFNVSIFEFLKGPQPTQATK